MQGVVLYTNSIDRAEEIRNGLQEKGGLYSIKNLDSISDNEISSFDYIAVEWDARLDFFSRFYDKLQNIRLCFYNETVVLDIDDTLEVERLINKAFLDKNWNFCKSLNEFLAIGDVFRKRTILRAKPGKFQIETTDLCNARCIMCSHAYSIGSGMDILRTGILDKLKDVLPYLKVVVIHGNGEPFLNRKLVKYLSMLSKYNIKFITNTNLSILNDDILQCLSGDFIELNVSCDGHTRELYESIRCGLSYEVFVNHVKKVREKCPNLVMKMTVVVMKQNLSYLSDIVLFAANLGFNEIVLNQLCVDEKNGNLEDAPYLYMQTYKSSVLDAVKTAIKNNIVIHYPQFGNDLEADFEEKTCNTKSVLRGICDWLIETPYINLQGNVGICCINQNIVVGNVFNSDFLDIWNGERYQQIREDFYNGKFFENCSGCDFLIQERLHYAKLELRTCEIFKKNKRD